MLNIVHGVAVRLRNATGLAVPPGAACCVAQPGVAEVIARGARGMAFTRSALVALPERHLSELEGVAAHELAHLAAGSLGRYSPVFKGEGFACYAASLIGAESRAIGLPVHYHITWLLSVGVHCGLSDFWARREYSAEVYDAGWSFAAFVAERFGMARYQAFYGSKARSLEERLASTLGMSVIQAERAWHEYARSCVPVPPEEVQRMHRYAGLLLSRIDWLRRR